MAQEVNIEGSESTVRGSSLHNTPISVTGLRCLETEDLRVTTGLPCRSVQHLWGHVLRLCFQLWGLHLKLLIYLKALDCHTFSPLKEI